MYEVESASDTTSALRKLQSYAADLALIDVMMPGKSGLHLLLTLRQDPRFKDLPLVVVTGNDKILEDDCQAYLGCHQGVRGPDGVLGKPLDPAALLAIVRHLTSPAVSSELVGSDGS